MKIDAFQCHEEARKCTLKAYLVLIFAELVHNQNGCGIIMGLNKVQSLGSGI